MADINIKNLGKFNESRLTSNNFWFLGSVVDSTDQWTTGNIDYSVISTDLKNKCISCICADVSTLTKIIVNEQISTTTEKLSNNLNELSGNFNTLNTFVNTNVDDLSSITTGHTNSINSLNTNVDDLKNITAGHTNSINSLNTSLNTNVDDLKNITAGHTNSINSLNTKLTNLTELLDEKTLSALSSIDIEQLINIATNVNIVSAVINAISSDLYSFVEVISADNKSLSCIINYDNAGYFAKNSNETQLSILSSYIKEKKIKTTNELPDDIYKPYSITDGAYSNRDDDYELYVIRDLSTNKNILSGQSTISFGIPTLTTSNLTDYNGYNLERIIGISCLSSNKNNKLSINTNITIQNAFLNNSSCVITLSNSTQTQINNVIISTEILCHDTPYYNIIKHITN